MTGFTVAALVFALLFMGLLITALHKSSGRDGSHAATRTTAPADNPPGTNPDRGNTQ